MLFLSLFIQTLRKYSIVLAADLKETKGYLYQFQTSYFGIPNFQSINISKNKDHVDFNDNLLDTNKDTGILYRTITRINKKFSPLIPKNQIKKTPLYVFINSENSLLNISDFDKFVDAYMVFAQKYSVFKTDVKYIQAVSSDLISIYKWIGVNHKVGTFLQNKLAYDVIDVEGNDTRITYHVNVTHSFPGSHVINIGRKHFNIYSRQFQNVDSVNILKKVLKYLRKQKYQTEELSSIESIKSPCFPYSFDGIIYNQSVWGSGKFSYCTEIIENIMLNSREFKEAETPFIHGTRKFFVAASPKTRSKYNLLKPNSTLEDLPKKASVFCSQEWNQNQNILNEDGSHLDCFRAAYQYVLFAHGLHLSGAEVTVAPQLGSDPVWPLGALLSSVAVGIDEADHVPMLYIIWLNVFAFGILFNIFRYIEWHFEYLPCCFSMCTKIGSCLNKFV